MAEKLINMKDFDYVLDTENIAEYPLEKRNLSKLLIFEGQTGKINDKIFFEISDHLPENSLMVVNDSKVIYARLLFKNLTGAQIEIFCMEPLEPVREMAGALNIKNSCTWKCMVGNLRKWKEKEITLQKDELTLTAQLKSKNENDIEITFSWNKNITFGEILNSAGKVPLPPYIKRKAIQKDQENYQTVYANIEGSVAAPTAGLHFTKDELEKIKKRNINITSLNLNVGAGTFLPVKTDNVLDHKMHSEKFYIGKDLVESLLNNSGKVISTGTTTLRALESLYWIGCKMKIENDLTLNSLEQWEYEKISSNREISVNQSFEMIKEALEKNNVLELTTSIMITPGYEFKVVNVLITNFHQPKSTLLMLVSAFTGDNWRMIYEHALENNYRFLSYGDSSLLFL